MVNQRADWSRPARPLSRCSQPSERTSPFQAH